MSTEPFIINVKCILGTDLESSFEPTASMTQSFDCIEHFDSVKTLVTSAGNWCFILMSYSREQGIVLKGLLEAINVICLDLEPVFMSIVTTSCAKQAFLVCSINDLTLQLFLAIYKTRPISSICIWKTPTIAIST